MEGNAFGKRGRKGSEKGMGKRSNERSPKADFAVALEVESYFTVRLPLFYAL